jgi:hypothetical protein
LSSKEQVTLIFFIIIPLILLGFTAGKMYMQYKVEKIDSEKSGLEFQIDLLKLRLATKTNIPSTPETPVIQETPVSVQPHSSTGNIVKTKKPQSIISNENNIIFAGSASSDDIDKLTLKGYKIIGMVDGAVGKISIFSNRGGDVEKLKLIMEDKSRLKTFHRLIYARGSNDKNINISIASEFYLHIVNVVEEILK